jgi:hypothetical protein
VAVFLDGNSNLSALRFATVRIRWNPMLPQCTVDALATQLQQAGRCASGFEASEQNQCPDDAPGAKVTAGYQTRARADWANTAPDAA